MKSTFELSAIDTLFFRDGKPFSMGDETWAESIFPPYPSVFYGMLRGVYFADHLDQLKNANAVNDPTKNLKITTLLPAGNGEIFYPIPADLYAPKGEPPKVVKRLKYHKTPDPQSFISEYELPGFLKATETGKLLDLGGKAFLTLNEFKDYLNDKKNSFSCELVDGYVTKEPKIGIGRDFNTRSATEGKLYRVEMKRFSGDKGELTFIVGLEGLMFKNPKGLARFGAENKSISYLEKKKYSIPPVVDLNVEYFILYLATPAIFGEGAVPFSWFKNYGLDLHAAVIGRTQYIGGFDLKNAEPKPMHKAVPEGSVYYLRSLDPAKRAQIISLLHEGNIYNLAPVGDKYRDRYQKEGYGLTYLGKFSI